MLLLPGGTEDGGDGKRVYSFTALSLGH